MVLSFSGKDSTTFFGGGVLAMQAKITQSGYFVCKQWLYYSSMNEYIKGYLMPPSRLLIKCLKMTQKSLVSPIKVKRSIYPFKYTKSIFLYF